MKFDVYKTNKYIKGSDTDSIFICLEPYLIKKYESDYNNKLSQDQIINEVRVIALEFEEKLNKFLSERISKVCNVETNQIEFKTETIIESVYWAGKRRYAQHIVDKEGLKVDDWDFKGLDVMKSNFPPLFREFGEGIIKKILLGSDKNQITKEIIEFKRSLNIIPWEKLLKPTGLKKMGEYIDMAPRSGEIFTKLKKKCPANTKAAIYYNDLLKFKKLQSKYPTIELGDKIYIAYLKQNPYRIDTIAFNNYNDPPEIKEFIEKFIDKSKMFDSVMKNKLENLYEDLNWGTLVLNENVGKFFNF